MYNLYVSCSNDVNDQEKTIDDVLLEHVGLPNVLPFALLPGIFYAGWVEGIILSQFFSLGFCMGSLLHA